MTSHSEAICISASVLDVFPEQCSLEEGGGQWHKLEEFWGDEKQRLQDFDGQTKPLSNSLEKHLLYDDYIQEPSPTQALKDNYSQNETLCILKGEDIKDIPTSYVIGGFESHELIAVGTYVDKNIIPGFQYKVRKNLSDEYLFNGQARFLETIGLGYGKRLTFQGDSLNENDNYFWSDSRLHGYGFTFQAISSNAIFRILNASSGQDIGRIIVNNPAISPDIEIGTVIQDDGRIEKRVEVHFMCDVVFSSSITQQNVLVEDVSVKGEATVVRNGATTKARVTKIVLQEFIQDNCYMLPEE
ncbi:uncharacterized protein LOC129972549 isoform X1 [Argiope bruennichi]|uniref:uncharacterized protein LOC129972549 isoform X1 n=1 Tax=Argiope bruennichi TaxID=94029 RepID=UPI0024942731|nr:uncharacterized protein LOC129972549 isoform X1 [Argiope bruennichi]